MPNVEWPTEGENCRTEKIAGLGKYRGMSRGIGQMYAGVTYRDDGAVELTNLHDCKCSIPWLSAAGCREPRVVLIVDRHRRELSRGIQSDLGRQVENSWELNSRSRW
jgi:hypothetical protein